MAGLFKNRTIRERLEKLQVPDIEAKLAVIKAWKGASDNGELQKYTETQCEQAFNADFFIKVLGYKAFPTSPHTIRPKANVETGGGQMPDAVLGVFSEDTQRVIAVVEIKDANTSLDKTQPRHGNLTPVQQAFKYKPLYKDAGFVIATNFIEFRLYRDNQLDFERFTLDELADPSDDYFNFRKFYFLLNERNFVSATGQTETEKFLSVIRVQQEEITKSFYREYKALREALIDDIIRNNTPVNGTENAFRRKAVEKAQKLIDRIVFVSFFEDAGLLPEGKLTEVVEYAKGGALAEPIWHVLIKFFNAIDEGSEKLGVPYGYNGELFKQDEELNSLVISDKITQRFVDFGKYNFQEDLSVTILGHIFEQSITDLAHLQEGDISEEGAIKKGSQRRREEGIYYTPEFVVDFIVRNSLGLYLLDRETEILKKHKYDSTRIKKDETYASRALAAYTEYQRLLRNIKVLDPACGSGAFLVRVFDFLLSENKRVSDILFELEGSPSLFDADHYIKSLLQNNIYGVDLNPESVEITKLSLWLKSAKLGQKLITLKDNIKCGNSLIDDESVAGERAFNWQKEFAPIMDVGGFDVVLGNPPYVDSETMVKKDPISRSYIASHFSTARGNWDLYIPFIEKAFGLVRDTGYFSMIVPNKWLSMDYGAALRKAVAVNTTLLADFSHIKVFEDAKICPIIIALQRAPTEIVRIESYSAPDTGRSWEIKNSLDGEPNWGVLFAGDDAIIKKVEAAPKTLDDYADVSGAFTTSEAYELVEYIKDENLPSEKYYKLINTGTVDKFVTSWGYEMTKYLKTNYRYPVVSRQELLEHFPRRAERFSNSKIIVSGIRHLECILDENNEYLAGKSTNVITNFKGSGTPYVLACIINSALMTYFIKRKYDTSGMGGGVNFSPNVLRSIPIRIDADKEDLFQKLCHSASSLSARLIAKRAAAEQLLQVELGVNELSSKQRRFYELDASETVRDSSEHLSLDQKEKAIEVINKLKKEVLGLIDEISEAQKAVDRAVFELYEISEEERPVILDFSSNDK